MKKRKEKIKYDTTPMSKNELIHWLDLNDYGKNYSYYMPNEIFEDILAQEKLKTISLRAFAYSYYYLSNHLYGSLVYTKDLTNYTNIHFMRAIGVKSFEQLRFIVKRGGVLDNMGYTISTTDYPVFVHEYDGNGNKVKIYTTASQEAIDNNYPKLPKNSFIKYPVKAFTRNEEYKQIHGDLCGTFYIFDNTHFVSIETFVDIVTNKELGHVGFYIFAFMSMMYDRFKKDGYKECHANIANNLGCGESTVKKYLRALKKYGFIDTERIVGKEDKLHYENAYFMHDKYKSTNFQKQ